MSEHRLGVAFLLYISQCEGLLVIWLHVHSDVCARAKFGS